MSHVTDVKMKLHDLGALREACEALGLEFREGQQTWNWYGTWVNDFSGERAAASQGFDPSKFGKGLHAVSVPGSKYEIGVVEARNGDGYELLYDAWGGHGAAIEKAAGQQLSRLKQEYAAAVTMNRARQKLAREGFTARRETLPNGVVRVRVVRR